MNTTSQSPLLTSGMASKPTLQIPPILDSDSDSIKIKSSVPPKRCCAEGCKKKLSLTDFPCKCGKICCSLHRAAEEHACTYNYRSDYTNLLQSTIGTAVIGKKVDTI